MTSKKMYEAVVSINYTVRYLADNRMQVYNNAAFDYIHEHTDALSNDAILSWDVSDIKLVKKPDPKLPPRECYDLKEEDFV
jgi:hypothetical protein